MTYTPEQLGDLIIAIYKEMKTKTEKDLQAYGIGMGQLHILMLFYARHDSHFSQNELVRLLDIDKGNISRNVKKLMDKNYLEQVPNHSKFYQLSAQGKQLKIDIMSTFISLHKSMTEGIEISEQEQTMRILRKIHTNLEEKQ
ncbi:MAG: MarR family transcriptional regulator [Clostridiales bacterium]|nr:MarR family transcriptional regulator [Clostridiales bacterium]